MKNYTKKSSFRSRFVFIGKTEFFLAFVVFISLLQILRSIRLFPMVLGDELTYSRGSLQQGKIESDAPIYLYNLIYGIARIGGDSFYIAAKILNVTFYTLGVLIIWKISKHFMSEQISKYVALAILIGPYSFYSTYFTPEALYFFLFCILLWSILGMNSHGVIQKLGLISFVLSLMSFVKPHAVFLVVPLTFYFWNRHRKNGIYPLKRNLYWMLPFLFLVFRQVIGFVCFDKYEFDLFGATYGGIALEGKYNLFSFLEIAPFGIRSLVGNVIYVLISCGFMLFMMWSFKMNSKLNSNSRELSDLTDLFMILLIFLLGAFSYSTGLLGLLYGVNETERVHQRYYEFIFPILIVIAGAIYSKREEIELQIKKIYTVIFTTAILLAALVFQFGKTYRTGWFDSPTMDSINLSTQVFWLFVGIEIIFILFFSFQPNPAVQKYFWSILLGLMVLVNFNLVVDQHKSGTKLYFDSAGIIVSNVIPEENLDDLVIVGDDMGGMLRTSFQFTQSVPATELLQPEEVFDFAVMGLSKEFALVLGDHKWINAELVLSMGDNAVLVKRKFSPDQIIDFSLNSKSQYLAVGTKFTRPNEDADGIWTIGKDSQICLQNEVPREYVINLYAKGFGPNVDQNGLLIINGEEKSFTLTSGLTAYAFRNSSNTAVKCLEFRAPRPASPKSLGLSGEEREIGILISKIFFTKQ